MEEAGCVVIGAGVVGLAVAAELGARGREVLVLEEADSFGAGMSSRNSEVVHAGLYYTPGSLKARMCVAGRKRLYEYCRARNIQHKRCGKMVVAVDGSEHARLDALCSRAKDNGVDDVRRIDGTAAKALEPSLTCSMALLSPSSGVIDSRELMLCLFADVESSGGVVAFSSPCLSGRLCENGGAILEVGGAQPMLLRANLLVNCAGLGAQKLARSLEGFPGEKIPPLYFGKGNYFALNKSFAEPPFSHLIYPLPGEHFLGAHVTCSLDGRVRLGPDLEWVDAPDYHVDPARASSFEKAVRRYWHDMPENSLVPDYAGIRPKLARAGEPAEDFRILAPAHHGCRGVVHLFGIESPGLTSCLAIADYVASVAVQ
ncbi:MAG: NAD(P)/FAD-dependent oxidoreductase [Hyphomicrobiales bacterium]|nr:NAD(P)/FAD-dependent oxidoreductase [Hyphomicrobiales bacterium]